MIKYSEILQHITKWKKSQSERAKKLYNSNYIAFWQRQNYRDNKKGQSFRREKWRGGAQSIFKDYGNSIYHYNDEYLLHIFPKRSNIQE